MITASIVLYNSPFEEVEQLLPALEMVEVLYLIDHSTNDDLSLLQNLSPKIKYIKQKNLGYGGGHNVALRKIVEENPNGYHLILNSDVVLANDVLVKLTNFMEEHTECGLTMPVVLDNEGNNVYFCKLLPTPMDLICRRFLPFSLADKRTERLQLKLADYSKIIHAPWLSGCFMFLRVNTLTQVGFFDERYFMYAEDIDFSRRFHQVSQTLLCPEVSIIHYHQALSYRNFKMFLVHLSSVIKYFNKWGWLFDKERSQINKKVLEKI